MPVTDGMQSAGGSRRAGAGWEGAERRPRPSRRTIMADISRNTTPAWQDPHLKDRGDYTEQDIQNIQEKGGILPDFTLDEAEETHLFARVAQALSKTLTRQGLAVRHEAKAAAEPMGYRLDEHAIAIDTRRRTHGLPARRTRHRDRHPPPMEGHRARPRARPRRHPGRTRRAQPGGPAARSHGMEQVQGQGPHGGRPAARLHRTPQLPLA